MRLLKYIRYFFYLVYNWNMRIAWHIIRHEIRGERKYGIDTIGADELKSLEKKGIDISHATIYMPASYGITEEIFKKLQPENLNNFVDIGCGKGRLMCIAAYYGFSKVAGIDFSKELCNAAIKNLEKTKRKFPYLLYQVINNDAFYYDIPREADCIFMFNPFDEIIMKAVIKNIDQHKKNLSKDLFIVYLNPVYKKLFLDKGYKEIFYTKKLNYLEGCILKK